MLRITLHYTNFKTYKILYKALVRPHLEYASTVRSLYTLLAIKTVKSVQNRFLRTAMFEHGIPMTRNDHDYTHTYALCSVDSLKIRSICSDLKVLHTIISGQICFSKIVSQVFLNALIRHIR